MSVTAAAVSIDKVLAHGQQLPSIPRVVAELLASFKREDCDADEIARLISADAMLSAKVLRLANSAFYRRTRQITSVRQATVTVGYVALRLMMTSVGIAEGLRLPVSMDPRRFWRFCLHAGVVARALSQKSGVDGESAFSAGLLHAVGHPAIRIAMPRETAELERAIPFCARERAHKERELWGFDYAQVGGRLAESWSFPPVLIEAIRFSAEPLAAPEYSRLAAVVRVACELEAGRELGMPDGQTAATFVDPRLLEILKLTAADLAALPPSAELAAGLESLLSPA
jgi:HD-like signal output (HDOD) protein